ncbi:M1 family metallopeptidase [Parapedobacter sp. SGR-10]|uniref:M1 family metallopeptidase n=1 Tax=Parapedobacter sp. SGR-10 TaxID=2710879 RepID=UPI0013D88295|nr:M1 family metallopeptidase [Parapedobacter sp. SGR-10]NGF56152.1 M1 family metallopeptidase [Parapedobacter sp. SGR-10]
MIRTLLYLKSCIFLFVALWATAAFAQQSSSYNYSEAFGPGFYTSNGTAYRSASGRPGPQYWQNAASYTIKARLDDKQDRIYGSVQIDYTNNSPEDLAYIWLQLDQNLFTPQSIGQATIPLEESRYGDSENVFQGGYKLSNLKVNQSSDIKSQISDTRMRIDIPSPIQAKGGKATLSMDFEFSIPTYGADRTGILHTQNGKIYSIAQWYPRLAVFDDILGWNTTPYTGPGEFYLEYGDYQVEITAPASHIVVLGGELLNPQEVWTAQQLERYKQAQQSNQTVMIRSEAEVLQKASRPAKEQLTWKYSLKNARDIAWASSPAFIVDGAKINLPSGKSALALSAYPKESNGGNAWERSTEYTKASIEHYSKKWYEYPYPVAVNVASNVGGMEYPAISFCGHKAKAANLWGVTDHEFGHNWFPMIVGSNERLHGWMDEGFNTFINDISTEVFNKGEYHLKYGKKNSRTQMLFHPALEPVMNSPQTMRERNIGLLVYYKPAYALHLLRDEIIGRERFDAAFKKYIEYWAFKHPAPQDFFRTIENETGENLSWFWRGMFQHNWQMDQAISEVRYVQMDPSKGAHITVQNLGKLPMPIVVEATTESGKRISVKLPVEVWERNTSWTFKLDSQEKLTQVKLDPRDVYPDINPENNVWKAK